MGLSQSHEFVSTETLNPCRLGGQLSQVQTNGYVAVVPGTYNYILTMIVIAFLEPLTHRRYHII